MSLSEFNGAKHLYRVSSGSSEIRDPVAHRTYTMKVRRRDILQAAGEASSEVNQVITSNQDTVRESQEMSNWLLLEISNLVVEWLL